jgi:FlaA1/EpsC-like NDP-sugar epimerase
MTKRSPSWLSTATFLAVDALVIYLAFVAAMKIRLGEWSIFPSETGITTAIAITVFTYLIVLGLAGLYSSKPESMHLDEFLKFGVALFVGWTVSLAVAYIIVPEQIPGRSITAGQCAFSLVGILGIRAVVRYWREDRSSRPTPRAVTTVIDDIDFAPLLGRNAMAIDHGEIRNYLAGRTVLVTGAGGSIGAKLCRRLIELNPFRLVMVDVSEYNLFQLENTLRNLRFEGELEFRIADVRDEAIMKTMFSAFHPDVVFHAAAYKHVPLMERHPVEAFTNNTLSTVSLLRLCEEYDAQQFVFVSTDKAVDPTSVLGATKRLSEWYVRAVNGPMRCKTVRFGNVLASHGSVVPFFTDQIERGGPVTVTHPEMKRFFMTADEACSLILQTVLLDSAPVYTIRMGNQIKIVELARFMINKLGPANHGISIEFTGIRPGEKLDEALWAGNELPVPTTHGDIVGLTSDALFSRSELDNYFRFLEQLCTGNMTAELRKALFQTKLSATPIKQSSEFPDKFVG